MATAAPQLSVSSHAETLSVSPHVETVPGDPPTSDPGTFSTVLCSSSQVGDRSSWVVNSGASDHMTFDDRDFTEKTPPQCTCVANANGVLSPVTGAGTVNLSPTLSQTNCLIVPSLSHKLLSMSQVTTALNCVVLMYSMFCLLQDILTKEIIGRGTKRGGLYYVDDFNMGRAHHMHHPVDNKGRQIWLWHRRLGHPSFGYMKHLFPDLFSNISLFDLKCETCILAKSHRNTYPLSMNKSSVPFALIHSDVWGPSPTSTISGIRWFVIFIDDCTRMTWLYLLRHKTEVLSVFQSFHTMVQTQFSAKIQILRSDNGGEYINREFREYFQNHGLIHETTCPYTPQQNGVAERKNRHILETARALLLGSHVPSRHWTDAVVTAVHLLNRMPSKVLDFKTPLHTLSTFVTLPTMLMIPPGFSVV
jgi:hypothetical protein